MATLDDVLSDQTETETQTPAAQTAPPEPVAAPDPVASGVDAAPPAANEVEKLVPLSAVEAERKGRKDWKEKALRTEGENALLKRQLEELKRAPVAPATPQQQEQGPGLPDPMLDPEGYQAAVVALAERRVLNMRWLDQEDAAKEKHGEEAVEAAFGAFSEAAKADPSLAGLVRKARNPWAEIMKWHKKHQAQAEIGDDPAAFREKLEKELREKILAEQGQAPASPTAPAAPRIPSSLASTPNVAGRSAPAFSGPDSLDDIVGRRH